jgi:UDP-2,3-diacylglucosamine hydrolase
MAKSDWKYRLIKRILVHPVSNWCFKQIHPDWGMKMAKMVGKASRVRAADCQHNEYQDKGAQLLEKDIDIVMHGHTHSAYLKEVKGGTYINTGDWFEKMRYIEMDNGNCVIKTYSA